MASKFIGLQTWKKCNHLLYIISVIPVETIWHGKTFIVRWITINLGIIQDNPIRFHVGSWAEFALKHDLNIF